MTIPHGHTKMSGIAGIQSTRGFITGDRMDRMVDILKYRGDVCEKRQCGGNVVFGAVHHQYGGIRKQTIAYDDSNKICVLLDGNIFHKSSAKEFSPLKSQTDAEILLNLYQTKGIDSFRYIDGSYAVAICDEKGTISLIRDRLGSRPLFYASLGSSFIFGTEIKAILASGLYRKSVNLNAVNNFLSYGYVPGPDSLMEGIKQVKPGHYLIYKEGKVFEKPYWKFSYRQEDEPKPEAYYKEKFLESFETAVSTRLHQYPDAGAFLSGGLDTSGVVAVMHKLRGAPFKVFTAGFEEQRYNEIGDAKILVDYLGLEHHTITIKFDNSFPALLEKLVWHHDAPFADTSAIPSYYAAKLAKEYVDVVFTGDFPDQLIGGSGHQVHALFRESNDPAWKRVLRNKSLNDFITRLHWCAGGSTFLDKLKRFLYRETFSLEEQRALLGMPVPPLLKQCLYSPAMLEVNQKQDPLDIARSIYKEAGDVALLDKLLYFDILSYAPDDLMVKVDRMTAAHGLTAISPFHDLELVEFMASVPTHLKIRGNERKYIMREALRPMLPEQILNKKKQGFAMPMGEWLMRKLSDYVQDILLDARTLNRGYFNKKFMRKMVENFLAGKTDYASGSEATIISLITLELWHRIFIDRG